MKNYSYFLITMFLVICVSVSAQSSDFAEGEIKVYTTSENSNLRLSETQTLKFVDAAQPLETEISVFVNTSKTYQTILGIGGAITDASAIVFNGLSSIKQQELLDAYYDIEKGIGYTLLRTTIHSSDFSPESYTYVTEGDAELKSFSIAHDKEYRIPMIKRATKTAEGTLTLYVSPWSPPAFMKTNGSMLRGGKLKPEFRQNWANYYAKFIKAYEAEGMPIWGLTIQNEPMATQTWESCIYTAEEERDFLKDYLGPTLEKEGLGDKNIVVWDHNRDLMVNRSKVIFEDKEAAKYAWGTGFHWYETWTGAAPLFENVNRVKEAFPDKNLMFTEGCIEKFDSEKYQYWPNGERYGEQIINDLNNGTVAWTDWNILLDQNGGPNHVGNFCFAPIHADTITGDLIYTPSYYYLGHFSKFIRPKAKRVGSAVSRNVLLSTSFVNDNGTMATVVMNKTNDLIKYTLYINQSEVTLDIPAHSIQTLIY